MSEKKTEKLIITATPNFSWINPKLTNYPKTADEIIEEVVKCHGAGAAIAHIHGVGGWKETISGIRDRCDIIIQAGMSSQPLADRTGIFENKPDMISIILNHHDEAFTGQDFHRLHPREELEEYCKKCRAARIKPEWEVWNTGSIWNLNYLIKKKLLDPPHYQTLFFGWPGGTWTPPTAEEFYYRVKYLPPSSVYAISVMGIEQLKIAALSIAEGGHVRVGTEDYPYVKKDEPAKNTAQLVENLVELAKDLGREVADPTEARKIIGIK
jgi:3-keto-5-aminohexanoate cleavage enzyme